MKDVSAKYVVKNVSLKDLPHKQKRDTTPPRGRPSGGGGRTATPPTPISGGKAVVMALAQALGNQEEHQDAFQQQQHSPSIDKLPLLCSGSPGYRQVAQALATVPADQAVATINAVSTSLGTKAPLLVGGSGQSASPGAGVGIPAGGKPPVAQQQDIGGDHPAGNGIPMNKKKTNPIAGIRHYHSTETPSGMGMSAGRQSPDDLRIDGISRSRLSPIPINKAPAGTLHIPTGKLSKNLREKTLLNNQSLGSISAAQAAIGARKSDGSDSIDPTTAGADHTSSPKGQQKSLADMGVVFPSQRNPRPNSGKMLSYSQQLSRFHSQDEVHGLIRERDALKAKIKLLEANAAKFQRSSHIHVVDAPNARILELEAQLAHSSSMLAAVTAENEALKVSKRRPSFQLPAPSSEELLEAVTSKSAKFRQALGEVLLDIAVAPVHEMDLAISKIIDMTYSVVDAHRISFFLVHHPTRTLVCHTSKDKALLDPVRMSLDSGIAASVVSSKQPLHVPDAYADERFAGTEIDRLTGQRTRAILCVPVFDSNGEVQGVVQALNRQGQERFSFEDEDNMLLVARTVSLCLGRIRDAEEVEKAQVRTQVLIAAAKTASQHPDADTAVVKITEIVYDALKADRVSVFLIDHVKGELWCKVSKDINNMRIVRIPIGHGIVGAVALTGQAINIPDAYSDPRFNRDVDKRTGYRTRSILAVAVCDHENKPIAVIQAINKYAQRTTGPNARKELVPFDEDDEMLLSVFAAEIASTIKNNFLNSVVRKLLVDPESEDYNRHLESLLAEFIASEGDKSHSPQTAKANQSVLSRLRTQRQDTQQFDLSKVSRPLAGAYLRIRHADFDIFALGDEQLAATAIELFRLLKFDAHFEIPADVLAQFVHRVQALYNPNPFHCFRHAVQVLHFVFLYLTTTNVMHYITLSDAFGLCVAAICHDLDHRGVNNAFEVASQSRLAILYNDHAVLENHHTSVAFKIIAEKECNIFASLSPDEFKAIRQMMIQCILSTDMAQHSLLQSGLSNQQEFSRDKEDDRRLILQSVLHSADISNPMLPHKQMVQWANLVMQEFNDQAAKERELGLPVSTFMERRTDGERAQLQMDFLDYVVFPFFRRLSEILTGLESTLANAKENRAYWASVKAVFEAGDRTKKVDKSK